MRKQTLTVALENGQRVPVPLTQAVDGAKIHERSGGTSGLLWTAAAAAVYELRAPAHFVDHAVGIVDPCAPPASLYWKGGDGETVDRPQLEPGSVFARSEQIVTYCRWRNARIAIVTISHEFMERALPEPFTKCPIELRPTQGAAPDPVLAHLIAAVGREAENGLSSGPLFFESLGNSLALYAATRFGIHPPRIQSWRSGLSRERRKRVLEYIDHRLGNDLTVCELAGVAHLSPYHFGKMFAKSMGESVHGYVVRRRLEHAKQLLREGQMDLAAVALAVGFSGQSQFTAAFRRSCGVTPGAYRRWACTER